MGIVEILIIGDGDKVTEMGNQKSKAIRGEKKLYVIHDPWSSKGTSFKQEDTSHYLSDSGSLESYTVENYVAFDCGCLDTPPGGFCVECVSSGFRGLYCNLCFGHCRCGRPICQSHSGFIYFSDGRELRLCGPCYQLEIRDLRLRQIIRRFLPFLEP